MTYNFFPSLEFHHYGIVCWLLQFSHGAKISICYFGFFSYSIGATGAVLVAKVSNYVIPYAQYDDSTSSSLTAPSSQMNLIHLSI